MSIRNYYKINCLLILDIPGVYGRFWRVIIHEKVAQFGMLYSPPCYALINREWGPYAEIFVLTFMAYGPNEVRSMRHGRQNKYFAYGPSSRLIRALLYTWTSKVIAALCYILAPTNLKVTSSVLSERDSSTTQTTIDRSFWMFINLITVLFCYVLFIFTEISRYFSINVVSRYNKNL